MHGTIRSNPVFSIRTKLILAVIILFSLTITVISMINFLEGKKILEAQTFENLTAFINAKQLHFNDLLDSYIQGVYQLSSRRLPRGYLVKIIEKSGDIEIARKEAFQTLKDAKEAYTVFETIDVMDLNGDILISTNPVVIGTRISDQKLLAKGKSGFYVSNVFMRDGQFLVDVLVPTYDPFKSEKEVVGVFKVTINLRDLMRILSDYEGLGRTGEMVLAQRAGADMLVINPLRNLKDAAFKLRIPINPQRSQPLKLGLEGEKGIMLGIDYRGKKVLSAYKHMPILDAGFVVKIDEDENFGKVVNLLIKITIASLMIFIFSCIGIVLATGFLTRPILEFARIAERISNGYLDDKIEVKSQDEIGVLAYSFQTMLSQLRDSQQRIANYTQELEKKVKERTQQLEFTNNNLERIVEERTQELQEKYRDLSKSQTAMLYMVEDLNRQSKELKEAQEKLIRVERLSALGQLASSVAHELRNPLGVMKNVVYYFNMLELGRDNLEIRENLDILSQEIVNSDKIITDLLEFARVKAPNLRMEDINLIVKETLSRIKVPSNVEMITELDGALPQIMVDALQLQQVIYNMAMNAIQSMNDGGKLKITSAARDGFIELSFNDTGCGIKSEDLTKIFDPLFSTKIKGTGLGLSVCLSLVEGHSGMIAVESEYGRGTTFTVKLPIGRV